MKYFSPERLAAGTTALVLLSGCTSQSPGLTSVEPRITVTEGATPIETTPTQEFTEAPTPEPTPSETEKPHTLHGDDLEHVVIIDTCESESKTYEYVEPPLKRSSYTLKTNIGKLAYGAKYDPSAPRQAICKQTAVPVKTILNSLIATIGKAEPETMPMSSSNYSSMPRKAAQYVATTGNYELTITGANGTALLGCNTGHEGLEQDEVCADGELSPKEIAAEMIRDGELSANFKGLVLRLTGKQKSLEKFGDLIAIVKFEGSNE